MISQPHIARALLCMPVLQIRMSLAAAARIFFHFWFVCYILYANKFLHIVQKFF